MRYNRPLSGPQLTGSFDPSVTVIGHRPEQQTLHNSLKTEVCVFHRDWNKTLFQNPTYNGKLTPSFSFFVFKLQPQNNMHTLFTGICRFKD